MITKITKTPDVIHLLHNVKRSIHWQRVRDNFLVKFPTCAVSGLTENLEVHHIFPFHYCQVLGRLDLELDERNLITLTHHPVFQSHLMIGHLGDYDTYNPDLKNCIIHFHKVEARHLLNDPVYCSQKMHRPTPLDKMSKEQKEKLRYHIDKTFPRKIPGPPNPPKPAKQFEIA